jgi:hypothetical protein
LLPVNSPKLCGDQDLTVTVDTVSCHDQLINMAITPTPTHTTWR